jgi:hypothetical protein
MHCNVVLFTAPWVRMSNSKHITLLDDLFNAQWSMNRYMVSYELPPNSLGEKDPITVCIGQFLFTDIRATLFHMNCLQIAWKKINNRVHGPILVYRHSHVSIWPCQRRNRLQH